MNRKDKIILGSLYASESSKKSKKPNKDTTSPGYYLSQYLMLIGSIIGLLIMLKEAIL